MQTGILQAALAYACWGLFPLYFHALRAVQPLEMAAHRVLWSLACVALLLLGLRRWRWLVPALRDRRTVRSFAASACLISANWLVYIWAVGRGQVVEASLGYFINPLVNVLVGWMVLHEGLRRMQWLAVALAAGGVIWIGWQAGAPPWIALALAGSFAGYGLLRKTAPLGALEGLALETALIAPLALAVLGWLVVHDQAHFVGAGWRTQALLLAAGPITAIPLLLFAAGARRIPFSLLGLLQYIGPSLQLLVGIWLLGEPFEVGQALGFIAIWCALLLYTGEGWLHGRHGAEAVAR